LLTASPFILFVLLVTGGRPLIALGTLLGPMAGPAARNWPPAGNDCCMDNGLAVLPWGLASLALALSTQWLLPSAWNGRLRLAGWILGIAGWCFCGLVTYAHALE
jgi:hypothetical protein